MSANVDDWKGSAADPELERFFRRSRRSGTLLAGVGTLVFVASVIFSFVRLRQVEQEVALNRETIQEQVAILERQRAQIEQNNERLATLAPAAVRGFGYEQAATSGGPVRPDEIAASLAAHDAVTELAALQPAAAAGQRVVYYAKDPTIDSNQENFVASLRDLGFIVDVERPVNPVRTSNALWFGRAVDPAAAELAAQAMIRAGYPLQYVGTFVDPTDRKAQIIEIGARPLSSGSPVLSIDLVSTAVDQARREGSK